MQDFVLKTTADVNEVLSGYPDLIQEKLRNLRRLVIEAATEHPEIRVLEETLKWGEPSYLNKHGSTIRIDWKEKTPDQYAMYFKCTSKLVATFKTVFAETFKFEGKRAIVFHLEDSVPEAELKVCIKTALRYHKLKELEQLGLAKPIQG